MLHPDQRLFEADLLTAEFRVGQAKGCWGLMEDPALAITTTWPKVFLWVAATPRPNAPERFCLALDVTG